MFCVYISIKREGLNLKFYLSDTYLDIKSDRFTRSLCFLRLEFTCCYISKSFMSVHNYSEIFQKIKEELSNIRDRKEKKGKKGKII